MSTYASNTIVVPRTGRRQDSEFPTLPGPVIVNHNPITPI